MNVPNYKRPLYSTWEGMNQRCHNPNHWSYHYYGGRGIKVCKDWGNFKNFERDMGVRPFEGATIDRKDNDGDYCKDNCRWATQSEQMRNSRVRNPSTSGHKGVSWFDRTNRWMVYITLHNKTYHLGYYKDKMEAIKIRKIAESIIENESEFIGFYYELKKVLSGIPNAGLFKNKETL